MRPIAAWWPPKEKNGSQMSSSQMPHFSLKSLKGWPPSTKCRRESILGQLKCEEVNCKKSIPKVRRSQLQEVNSREAIIDYEMDTITTQWEEKKYPKSGKHSEKIINKQLFGLPAENIQNYCRLMGLPGSRPGNHQLYHSSIQMRREDKKERITKHDYIDYYTCLQT